MPESKPRTFFHFRFERLPLIALAGMLAGCTDPAGPHRLPPPTKVVKPVRPTEMTLVPADDSRRTETTSSQGLAPPVGRTLAEPFSSSTPPKLTGENISVNFEGIKLPAFVNTVFGELLKVNFDIDSSVAAKEQLVTLRTADPLPPDQFYRVVTEVLSTYGLSVVYTADTKLYRIVEATTMKQDVPRIIRSRALSSVPGDQRPIFFFTPIHNVQNGLLQGWLELALGNRIRFSSVANSNGILLMGRLDDINAALETIEILDQPAMAGNRSLKISPAYWSAGKLAEQLATVLSAEGYSASVGAGTGGAIRMIPIDSLNTIIVFSTSEATLQHVLQWAHDLDQPSQTVNTQGMYYYQVQNASAKKVADLVASILGQSAGGSLDDGSPAQRAAAASAGAGAGAQVQNAPRTASRQKITVDETRNAIIFQGTAEEYAQFRGLLEQMDRPPLEVMIEATVAEVTLDKNESLGVVLGFDDKAGAKPNSNVIQSDTGLLVTLLRSRGQINANITALSANSNITVLSTPRLVTTSGSAASIQVGSQVPIITTQQTAATGAVGGTSNILQDVQYRNTGVMLNIKPTINSNRRVELSISQEVSSAAVNNISKVDSPIIQQRSIQTTLSLGDGETALLGGLITDNYNDADSGVPYLKDIPLLGNLFKNQSKSHTRTELIVLLTPYIIDGPEASRAVLDAFKSRLSGWANDAPNPADATKPTAAPDPG